MIANSRPGYHTGAALPCVCNDCPVCYAAQGRCAQSETSRKLFGRKTRLNAIRNRPSFFRRYSVSMHRIGQRRTIRTCEWYTRSNAHFHRGVADLGCCRPSKKLPGAFVRRGVRVALCAP